MQTYLLDTHCLIWFQENNPRIPKHILEEIQDPGNKIFFSQISLFEITIKKAIGKLPDFKTSIEDVFEQAINDGFSFLPIQNKHLFKYEAIPLIEEHKDPFDRLIIATAYEEGATILTVDANFKFYSDLVKVEW